ncbi:mycothiol transferase [Streptomyces griseorubiginosus]|uniref:mycothiol transferase n=1 Tax=Streptomyces griseorubiginosus TaxID=67304 RepID=UPI0036E292CE
MRLGLVKHVATVEARYFGEAFDRPSPEPLCRWQDSDVSGRWAAVDEDPRSDHPVLPAHVGTLGRDNQRVFLDAPGHVPWWPDPSPNTNLFAVMTHLLAETARHAGNADILRKGRDGQTGLRAEQEKQIDEEARAAHHARIEKAARMAAIKA